MMPGVNRKVCLESSLTVVVKVSGTADTLQNVRKSVNFLREVKKMYQLDATNFIMI